MIVMGYIAEATDNTYSPLLCSHIFTFCTKSEVSKAVRRKGKQNASRLHFFTVGWAVYPIAFTCPTLRNIYCTPSRISSTRRFIAYKINLSLNAGVAVESNHVGRTYNLCKYATLGQDTRRALELILLDLQRNISYCHSWRNSTKHVQERSVHRTYNGCYVRAAAICWIPTVPLLIGKTVCQAERILRNM
jgi:hypothetical protein